MERSISTNGMSKLPSTGSGYVVIPEDLKRSDYIRDCYKNNRVSVKDERGYFENNVPINSTLLSEISFPSSPYKNGSIVVWITLPNHDQPIIVSVLNNVEESEQTEENQFKIQRRSKEAFVDIDGSANRKSLSLSVVSKSSSASMSMKIINPDMDSEFDLYCSGNINIHATSSINVKANEEMNLQIVDDNNDLKGNISYKKGVGLIMEDEFDNNIELKEGQLTVKSGTKVLIETDNLILNSEENSQSIVKGDDLNKNLNLIITEIQKIMTYISTFCSTQSGVSGTPPLTPLNSGYISLNSSIQSMNSSINNLKNQLSNHLSKQTKTQ